MSDLKRKKIEEDTEEEKISDEINELFEKSKHIPVRLKYNERKDLRILESALYISEYTSKIDILAYNKKSRIIEQLTEICTYLSGLLLTSNYNLGQKLLSDKKIKENEEFFRHMFEIGRRHKIMNPEKMRSEYGKLVYLLQDSQIPDIQDELEFSLFKKVKTVYDTLEEHDLLKVLKHPKIVTATMEIVDDKTKKRYEIEKLIKKKEAAVEEIALKFSSYDFPSEEIRQCLYSIGDANSFLNSNMAPIHKMIKLLQKYFSADEEEEGYSLSINSGSGGARLTHNHKRQYLYVYQSLTLWADIQKDMFKLWHLAEDDLFDKNNRYKLSDTGQGLNRVQYSPKIGQAMSSILHKAQMRLGNWVGSSVIHLGDHNVPNALMFIDKYTQVPRIINPIVLTIEQLDEVYTQKGVKGYIDSTFGGLEECKKLILLDFFRHGFDGSGADNFIDAGSCIDGRLTSAWNWCSVLHKKSYFTVFKLTGFNSFDGDFQK
eukprot:gene8131-12591_t